MSDFSGGTVDKNLPATAGDMGLIPAPGRSHMPRSNEAQDPQLLKFLNRAHALQQETPPQWETHASRWGVVPTPHN